MPTIFQLQQPSTVTNNHLAHELNRLGVPFVRTEAAAASVAPIPPATLLAGLAASDEARLRLALIPLLLVLPEYAVHAPEAAAQLSPASRLVFVCYYTAAMLLQQLHAGRIRQLLGETSPLPDLFAAELGVPIVGLPTQRLTMLAARHAALGGDNINWLGTYHHGAERLFVYLEKAARWPG